MITDEQRDRFDDERFDDGEPMKRCENAGCVHIFPARYGWRYCEECWESICPQCGEMLTINGTCPDCGYIYDERNH